MNIDFKVTKTIFYNNGSHKASSFDVQLNESKLASDICELIDIMLYGLHFDLPGIWAYFHNEACFSFDCYEIKFEAIDPSFNFENYFSSINQTFELIK